MKKLIFVILLLLPFVGFGQAEKRYRAIIIDSVKALSQDTVDFKSFAQFDSSVAIGAGNVDPSALLTMISSDKGLLTPRMNTAARDAISSPADGLLIFNTQTAQYEFFETTWQAVGGGADGDGIYDGSGSLTADPTTVTMGTNNLAFTSTVVDGFSVDGTTFSVDASNNRVGVGFAAPTARLNIRGVNAAGTSDAFLAEDNVGTDLMVIQNDGLVGINSPTPTAQLHVIASQQAGIRFGDVGNPDYIEFGTDGGTSISTPTLRSNQTGEDGSGCLYINEIAVADDLLGAGSHVAAAAFLLRKIGGGTLSNARLFTVNSATSSRFMVMPDGDMLFHAVNLSGFLGNTTPDVAMDFRLSQADVLGIRNGEVVGDNVTQDSPTLRISGLYDINPSVGPVTSTDFKSEIRTFVTTAGASPTGRMALSVEGNEGLSIDENGVVSINGIAHDQSSTTLGVAATTFAVTSTGVTLTGDGGGNTVATITGYSQGGELTLIFTDGNVTITDDNTHAANSVDLSAAFTGADDTVLYLRYDGTSWYEINRSTN